MRHPRLAWGLLATCAAALGMAGCNGDETEGGPGGGNLPSGSGGSGSGGTATGGNGTGGIITGTSTTTDEPDTPAPALNPQILLVTYLGGAGNQYVREVAIGAGGNITAKGKSFVVSYDAGAGAGEVTGDASADDPDPYSEKPTLYKQWNNEWTPENGGKRLDDPRFGLTYYFGTQQVSSDSQQPIFLACKTAGACSKDSQEYRLWTWWASLVGDKSLQADSRGYDLWLMPGGLIAVQAWTDGGNSTLGRDPRRTQECSDAASCTTIDKTIEELSWSKDTWQPMPNSMSTMYMTIDPVKGEPVRATFLRGSHVTRVAHDPWGRLIIPQAVGKAFPTVDPDNPFGHAASARSGLFVLDREMKSLVNARLGGTCEGDGTLQALPELALKDGLLVMGGTTCAQDLKVTDNAIQKQPGGAQDGFLVVIKLW